MEEELKNELKNMSLKTMYISLVIKNPYQYLSQTKVLLSMSKQEGFPECMWKP